MKLAVVCYPTFGGSGVVATELAMALAERGHEVHVVSYEQPIRLERWVPNLSFHEVEVGSYPLFRHQPYGMNLSNLLIELVEQHGVEVIHSHYAIPHAQAAWMARAVLRDGHCRSGRDVKLACTLHGTDITLVGRHHSFHELTRFAIDKQDLLTAPSRWLAEQTESAFGIAAERIRVIPNFVDLERFCPKQRPEVRRALACDGQYVITHASNFRPVKRVEDLVRGFATLRKRLPAVLALAGDGPDLSKAESLARELGVRDDLRLLGRHERIEDILQISDIFMLPSNAESFGLVALEAMACGCPVIGYRAGGLPEVVIDGETGLLCPVESDLCLGSLAADLLEDRERYAAMREAARKQAERFDAAPIVTQYEQALRALVDDPVDQEERAMSKSSKAD